MSTLPKDIKGIDQFDQITQTEPPAKSKRKEIIYLDDKAYRYHRTKKDLTPTQIRYEHLKIVRPDNGRYRLFNLRQDPYETNDIGPRYPALRRALEAKLKEALSDGKPLITREDLTQHQRRTIKEMYTINGEEVKAFALDWCQNVPQDV